MASSLPGHASYSQQPTTTTSYIEKLSDWDSPTEPLAPLTSDQKDSYLELASIAGNRPLPIELPLDEPVNIRHKVSTKQVHPAGSIEDVLSRGFAELGMTNEKIQDVQQFYSWFNKVEEKMAALEAEGYTEHVDILKTYKGHCSNIIVDIDQALSSLKELEKEYVFVSTKTNALHDACEQLLADQTKLINTAESIEHDLAFFNELDRITTKLHSPSLAVTGESFQALLTRIDECIKFMETHSTYKDSLDYLTKFKVCLSNALTMIKDYVVKSLNETTKGILNRKVSVIPTTRKDNSSITVGTEDSPSSVQEDAFTLYYGKFRTNAPRILGLVEQIEKRIELNVEYGNYLSEIHHCYFRQREQLVGPSVTTAMSDLLALNKQDQCALVRSGCSFMVHVCEDEHQLYGHFFTTPSTKLDEMLRQLCINLYDMLRPLIIHVYHLETLAELCTILKTEMIDDHVQNNPRQLQAFEFVVKQMLEDVQERLVFRANIHIRDDILGYKPAPGDLAYPEKLQMMEEIAKSLKEAASKQAAERSFIEIKLDDDQEQAGSNKQLNQSMPGTEAQNMENSIRSGLQQNQPQRFQTSPADMHGMWYPTVRRVLVCLSKLYRCIDKTIFQGLSQEALQACVQSLVRASNSIRTQEFASQGGKGAASKTVKPKVIDSQLFLIKHLLILREQIAPFHAEFAIRETQLDFSRTKDAAYQMLEFSTIPKLLRVNSNNALLQFFAEGAPEVKEFYIDSKKDVDRQLKYVCEEFIEHVTKVLVGVLDDFLTKARLVLNVSSEEGGPKTSLRQQTFATPEHLKEVVSSAYRELKLKAKSVHGSLSLYLANKDTENILFKPIKLNVQQAYQQLEMILLENYTEEDRAIIAAPSPDQMGVASLLTITEPGDEDNKIAVCYATVGLIATPTMISSLIMAAIAMDRYIWVRNPFRDNSSDNFKLAIVVTAVWIISILVGFAPLLGWRNQNPTFPYGRCVFLLVTAPSYIIFVFFGFFLPTVSVTAYLHIVMCKASREQGRKIAACEVQNRFRKRLQDLRKNDEIMEERASAPDKEVIDAKQIARNYSIFSVSQLQHFPPRSLSEGDEPLPNTDPIDRNDNIVTSRSSSVTSVYSEQAAEHNSQLPKFLHHLKPMKWSRTVILILGLFVCMWMPFWLACVTQALCQENCHIENLISTYLVIPGIANSAVNPLVYISTDKRLKKHFCQCFFRSANEESNLSFSSNSSQDA